MARIEAIDHPDGKARELLDQVQSTLGVVPNLFKVLGHSPATLEGFLGLFGGLGHGRLSAKLREQIALAVAESNGCSYCLSAHTAIGSGAGISSEEIAANREARSSDPKVEAALRFAKAVNDHRGAVGDADWEAVRNAGWTDAEIIEIFGNVAINVFTNFVNIGVETEIDFPVVVPHTAESMARA
jgi:uncharacterized peroxidase-related enzyme